MPSLVNQQDFRTVRNLPFCYLCGRAFESDDNINNDHLPASALFAKEDRDTPLILPTHNACNEAEHVNDEMVGQLISFIHGRPLAPNRRPFDGQVIQWDGQTITQSRSLNLHHFIRRCVRGFHAALYHEWLPSDTGNAFHPPLRGGVFDGNTGQPTDDFNAQLLSDKALKQHALWTMVLKQNRVANNTDKVVSRNSKCIYECVWTHLDDGSPFCIFGLKIYEWQRIGDIVGYPSRGCVGMYSPKTGRPYNATQATDLEFDFKNREKLDPFGE